MACEVGVIRVVFFGTPALALPVLEALTRSPRMEIMGVVTAPDKPQGRGRLVLPPPVKVWAMEHAIPVYQPATLKTSEVVQALQSWAADVFVVTAYGLILPKAVLEIPRYGCVNVHLSLLPKYRGAAPVARTIQAGERETGVTIFQMNERMDAGPILAQRVEPVLPDDTTATLEARLIEIGARMLVDVLPDYVAGRIQPVEQDESQATLAPKLRKEEGQIDWTQHAEVIERHIRAMDPWPSAYTYWRGRLLKIWRARVVPGKASALPGATVWVNKKRWVVACGEDALELLEVQLEGRNRIPVEAFLQGYGVAPGETFQWKAS